MSAPATPSGVRHISLRSGVYADSVRLMQVSREISGRDGVSAVLVAMATPLNLELAAGMGLAPDEDAGPEQLLIAVRRQAHAGGQLEVQRGGHRDQHGADAVPGADVPADLHQADRVGVDAAPQGDVPDALAVVHLAGRYRTKRLSGEGLGLLGGVTKI